MSRGKKKLRQWYEAPPEGTRARLVWELDREVSRQVRERDDYRCVICGSTYEPQAGHIFKRGRHTTRWDMQNIWTQCSRHNLLHNENPDVFIFWFVEKFGSEAFAELRDRAYSKKRFTDAELEELLTELKRMT